MKQDWTQVQTLAQDLGNSKWQYRALAQLGIAAFYDADLETARKNIGTALVAATQAGDIGAQIRILMILSRGLLESKMYEQALAYVEKAIKIAAGTPDAGDQLAAQELRINVLIGLGRLDAAQRTIQELLTRARDTHRAVHEATLYGLAARIALVRNDREGALEAFHHAITFGKSAGLTRVLSGLYSEATETYRASGDLENAQRFAELASASAQASGDLWNLPALLQALAELQVARGEYQEADQAYDRAETFLDTLIGNASTGVEQTAVITDSSQIYSQDFALIADHFNDPKKAYSIIEQVRGRAAADLLVSGLTSPPAAKTTERTISRLRLKLMAARSTTEVGSLRDEIFMAEQARWITPGSSVLKSNVRDTVAIEQIQDTLAPTAVFLEYVMADLDAYCLTITRSGSRIVHLGGRAQIEALIVSYLKAVNAKLPAIHEAQSLYDALIRPIRETAQAHNLIVVPDGQLHLIPFDALRNSAGRYIVETQTVIYSPSASSFLPQERCRASHEPLARICRARAFATRRMCSRFVK